MNKIAETGAIRDPVVHPVSLVLDASPLLLRSAGVKNYVYYWARSLAEHAGANRLSLFPFLRLPASLAHETSAMGRVATLERLGLLFAAKMLPFPILNWLTPASIIFHASTLIARPPSKSRLTSTIYDMTCWLMPQVHTEAMVNASERIATRLFRPAAGLIAISESTRADAVRLLGLQPGKIEVIYPGIAPAFFEAGKEASQAVARRYGLAKPCLLYTSPSPRDRQKSRMPSSA